MNEDNLFEDDLDLDGSELLAKLAIDPNAKQSDSPPPPPDGVYNVKVTLAPITKDGPFKGKAVKPFVVSDKDPTPKPSKNGMQDATLYISVTVLDDKGNILTRRPQFPNSMVGNNGTSDVIALAKAPGFGFIEGETPAEFINSMKTFIKSQAEDIKAQSEASFTQANFNWLLTEALAVQLEKAGEAGLTTTAVLKSSLLQDTGKRDAKGYTEWKTVVVGSDKIQELGMWKGGLQPDKDGKTCRIELSITDFGTPIEA